MGELVLINWAAVIVIVSISGSALGKTCKYPGAPTNGATIGNVFDVGSTVTFVCHEGYRLRGISISTCLSDFNWSQIVATCDPVTCPALAHPAHGKATYTLIAGYKTTVTFTCDVAYISNVTTDTRQCQQDGTWSGQEVFCVAIDCGMPTLANGQVRVISGTTFANTVLFTCDAGATMVGEDRSICSKQQQWDPPIPSCNYKGATTIVVAGTTTTTTGITIAPTPPIAGTTPVGPSEKQKTIAIVVGTTMGILALIATGIIGAYFYKSNKSKEVLPTVLPLKNNDSIPDTNTGSTSAKPLLSALNETPRSVCKK